MKNQPRKADMLTTCYIKNREWNIKPFHMPPLTGFYFLLLITINMPPLWGLIALIFWIFLKIKNLIFKNVCKN